MKQLVETKWLGNKAFESCHGNHKVIIDTSADKGGDDRGFRAKPLLLSSFAGCMGINIVSFLKKMQIEIESFRIITDASIQDEHPQFFEHIHAIYEFKGNYLPLDKIEMAIQKSEGKYCGVSATLKKALKISYEIRIIS